MLAVGIHNINNGSVDEHGLLANSEYGSIGGSIVEDKKSRSEADYLERNEQ